MLVVPALLSIVNSMLWQNYKSLLSIIDKQSKIANSDAMLFVAMFMSMQLAGYLKEFKLKQGETITYFFISIYRISSNNSHPSTNHFPLMETFEILASRA